MRLRVALDAARGLKYLHEEMDNQVAGTAGYSAPEYMLTGHLTTKSDTWSYGVVLFELICPIDRNHPKGERKLLEWVKPYVANSKKFYKMLDPRLGGEYSLRSATKLASVASRCLARQPKDRPKMGRVLEMVKGIVEGEDMQLQPPLKSCNLLGETGERERLEDLRRQGWIPKLIRTC